MEKDNSIPEVEQEQQNNEEQDESTEETEVEESQEESNDEQDEQNSESESEDEPNYQAKLNATNRFLEKEGYEWKDGKWVKSEQPKKKPTKKDDSSTDEVTLSRLEVRGVMETEDQEYVLRFAKAEGISPIEALNDQIVKDRLEANKRRRNSESATPRSNNRAANQVDEVDSYVRKYKLAEANGKDPATVLPENNPALTSKILDKLTKGA